MENPKFAPSFWYGCIQQFTILYLYFFYFSFLASQADSFHMPAKALSNPRLILSSHLEIFKRGQTIFLNGLCRNLGKAYLWSCAHPWYNLSIQAGGIHWMALSSWTHPCHRQVWIMWMTMGWSISPKEKHGEQKSNGCPLYSKKNM